MKVWELDGVPLRYQMEAWNVWQAKREALAQIAKDSGAMAVYVLDI